MTREELEHAIRAACDVSREESVVVFGSQAILGKYPDASARLRQSMEVDIAPGSNDPGVADAIDGVLGEYSLFHETHGFYVHGLTIESALLPHGWERRTIERSTAAGRIVAWAGAWRRTTWQPANLPPSARRTATSCERSWRNGW
jgi:hypothetical protein